MAAMQVHFTLQYGLDQLLDQDWQLEQPVNKPWLSPVESALKRLLEVQALSQHAKPGGYFQSELETVSHYVTILREEAGRASQINVNYELGCSSFLEPHMRWCQQLAPILARSVVSPGMRCLCLPHFWSMPCKLAQIPLATHQMR